MVIHAVETPTGTCVLSQKLFLYRVTQKGQTKSHWWRKPYINQHCQNSLVESHKSNENPHWRKSFTNLGYTKNYLPMVVLCVVTWEPILEKTHTIACSYVRKRFVCPQMCYEFAPENRYWSTTIQMPAVSEIIFLLRLSESSPENPYWTKITQMPALSEIISQLRFSESSPENLYWTKTTQMPAM